jgi:hypothetical protein
MILLLILGVWALAAGKVTILSGLKLEGKEARMWGAGILVYAFLFHGYTVTLLASILPASLLQVSIFLTVLNISLVIAIAVGMVYLIRQISPVSKREALARK